MKASRWLITALLSFALLASAVVLFDVSVDLYGIFRNAKGRHLRAYGDDRVAKYLLSEHYVPENFDSLLIGPSITANWDTHGIHEMRVYNESLDGANYVEEAAIVDQALATPGIRLALILVHPSLTASHNFQTVQVSERENVAALGSLSVMDAYKDFLLHSLRKKRPLTDDYGSDIFDPPTHLNAITRNLMRPGCEFPIDPDCLSCVLPHARSLSEARSSCCTACPANQERTFRTQAAGI